MPDDKETYSSPKPPTTPPKVDPVEHLLGRAALHTGMKHNDLELVRLGKELMGEIPKRPSKFKR